MENMAAFAPYCVGVGDGDSIWAYCTLTKWTVVARYLTCGAATFVWHATYATNITLAVSFIMIRVSGVPSPLSNSMP